MKKLRIIGLMALIIGQVDHGISKMPAHYQTTGDERWKPCTSTIECRGVYLCNQGRCTYPPSIRVPSAQ